MLNECFNCVSIVFQEAKEPRLAANVVQDFPSIEAGLYSAWSAEKADDCPLKIGQSTGV
jgi:hypothetical protein